MLLSSQNEVICFSVWLLVEVGGCEVPRTLYSVTSHYLHACISGSSKSI